MRARVIIFDDVVFARGEVFHLPGVEAEVYEHADSAPELVAAIQPDLVFMDFAMGSGHKSGAEAIRALREAGFTGRIVAISSDPALNARMLAAGADESLAKKALLRSYLMDLGSR
jgi:DNA-binding NarL/FixJ family response regulator